MTAPAWMPLYVADYLADTGHLSTIEHGAYLLLIMHYWQNGGLPEEDAKLARIARMSSKEWASMRDTIASLFASDWKHKRIDAELAKASENMERRSAAGKAGASARYGKRTANAQQSNSNPPSPSPIGSAPNGAGGKPPPDDPTKALWDRGVAVLGEKGRGLLGKLRREHGDVAVLEALSRCESEHPSDPAAFFIKCLASAEKARASDNSFTFGVG